MTVNRFTTDSIPIDDRGLAYGDGLFETVRINSSQTVLLDDHLKRLINGADRLGIPLEQEQLLLDIESLTPDFPENGVLKIILTRGSGGRGYRPDVNTKSRIILSLHPLPDYGENADNGVSVFICQQRLAHQPSLAGIKHLNRLEQVMASREWPEGDYMEGLMMDMEDNIIEGTRSNIFWSDNGKLFTPDLSSCGVAGILRDTLLQHIPETEISNQSSVSELVNADELFICNSVFGAWPVKQILTEKGLVEINSLQTAGFTQRAKELFARLLEK